MTRRIVVAATGGVAAIKTPALLRRLREQGHELKVAATEDAYKFITPLSLAVAAGAEVFDREAWFKADGQARHISVARWAEVLVVAPASADALASAASGRADDVVSSLILAGLAKVVWCPAMNTAMWQHPAVQENVTRLKEFGHLFIGPTSGTLAAQGEGAGVGRMEEPEMIATQLDNLLDKQDLKGQQVLVSAGPTREYLDPVRFLSNPSSGRMGFAVAEAARNRGAKVTLVSGPTALTPPTGVEVIAVASAIEMKEALEAHFASASMVVMTAAVADWRPADVKTEKEAKTGEQKELRLVRNPDILEALARQRHNQVMVGFAMETHQGVARAQDKAQRKGLNFICLNYPTRAQSAFGGEDNQVTIVYPDGQFEELPLMSKRDLADEILSRALAMS